VVARCRDLRGFGDVDCKRIGRGNIMAIDPERRAAIVEALQATPLQAVASVSPQVVLLLTGYWPVIGSSLALVTRDGDFCVLVPEDELDLALATSNADVATYQPHSLDSLMECTEALIEPLKRLAAPLHLSGNQIGTDLCEGLQPASYLATNHLRISLSRIFGAVIPEAVVVSADRMLDRLKSVKTTAEMDQMQRASALTARAFRDAEGMIDPGRREDEVAADIGATFAGVASDGFERGAGYFFCMSGPNAAKGAAAYARTRRRVIKEGDLVMIHANTFGDGYWTDITRTFIAGNPSVGHEKMRTAIALARSAALAAIAPGVAAKLVDEAARDVLREHGFGAGFKHATGHGVGFAAANPDALPRIHPQSPDVLMAGMTFNIEPAIYIDGIGGMRHCDVVACTESGAEVLTNF
jgi:Xaa-Pro aminopeptidase